MSKNIREAGQIERQEDKQNCPSAYEVNKTEATTKASAQAVYALGRKMVQRQERLKKLHRPKSISEAESLNEMAPEKPNINEAASSTVGMVVNPSEKQSYTVADEAIRTLKTVPKNELDMPLTGRLIKSETAAERIKDKKNNLDLPNEDKKTVQKRQIYRVKSYIGSTDVSQDKPNDAVVRQALNRDIKIKNTVSPKTVTTEYPKVFIPAVKSVSEIAAENSSGRRGFAAKQSIKTRENQFAVNSADADNRDMVSWEQGRKLAIKNLSEKKLLQRVDDTSSDEQYVTPISESNLSAVELFPVQEQSVNDVTDVGSVGKEAVFGIQPFKEIAGRQQKIANIKTREYVRNDNLPANSVLEINSGGQRLFGKPVFGNLKYSQDNKKKQKSKAV